MEPSVLLQRIALTRPWQDGCLLSKEHAAPEADLIAEAKLADTLLQVHLNQVTYQSPALTK